RLRLLDLEPTLDLRHLVPESRRCALDCLLAFGGLTLQIGPTGPRLVSADRIRPSVEIVERCRHLRDRRVQDQPLCLSAPPLGPRPSCRALDLPFVLRGVDQGREGRLAARSLVRNSRCRDVSPDPWSALAQGLQERNPNSHDRGREQLWLAGRHAPPPLPPS